MATAAAAGLLSAVVDVLGRYRADGVAGRATGKRPAACALTVLQAQEYADWTMKRRAPLP